MATLAGSQGRPFSPTAVAEAPQKWSGAALGTAEGLKAYLNRRRYSFKGEGGVADWNGTAGTDNLPLMKSLAALGKEVELEEGDYWFDNSALNKTAVVASGFKLYARPGARIFFSTMCVPMWVLRNTTGVVFEGVQAVGLGIMPASFPVTRTAFDAQFGTTFAAGDRDYNYWCYLSGGRRNKFLGLELTVQQPTVAGYGQRGWFNVHPHSDSSTGLWNKFQEISFDGFSMGILMTGQDEARIENIVADHRCQHTPSGEAACHVAYISSGVSMTGTMIRNVRDRGNFVDIGAGTITGLYSVNFRGVTDGLVENIAASTPYGFMSINGLTNCRLRNLHHRVTGTYVETTAPVETPDINTNLTIDGLSVDGDYGAFARLKFDPGSGKQHVNLHLKNGSIKSPVTSITGDVVSTRAINSSFEITYNLSGTWTAAGSERAAFQFLTVCTAVTFTGRSIGTTPIGRIFHNGTSNTLCHGTMLTPDGANAYGSNVFSGEGTATGVVASVGNDLVTRRSNMGTGTAPSSNLDIAIPHEGIWELDVTWSNLGKTEIRRARFEARNIGGTVTVDGTALLDRVIAGTNITALSASISSSKVRLTGTGSISQTWYASVKRSFVGPLI